MNRAETTIIIRIPSQFGIFLLLNQFSMGKRRMAINRAKKKGINTNENSLNTNKITTDAIINSETFIILISLSNCRKTSGSDIISSSW